MRGIVILTLRSVIVLAVLGSLVVQGVLLPLLWADLDGAAAHERVGLVAVVFLGVLALQVVAVCVWRLLGLVRRGTVFSHAAFRYVDVVVGAIVAGSLLVLALAVLLAPGATAPGVVGLLCGISLVVGGVALLVVVLRMLLAQAVDLDREARVLQAQLDEVI